jgi:hypothetical protein
MQKYDVDVGCLRVPAAAGPPRRTLGCNETSVSSSPKPPAGVVPG